MSQTSQPQTGHSKPSSRQRSPLGLLVLLLATVGVALFQLSGSIRQFWMVRGVPTWIHGDLDTGLIHFGLTQAPRFGDTYRWLVGPWVGVVPFYRPLTSYVFWIEWKLFGDHEWLYLIPAVGAHVLAACAFVFLVVQLARRWGTRYPLLTGVLAGAIFTRLLCPEIHASTYWVAVYWKNQPDSLATFFCCLSLCAYLAARDRGRRFPWAALSLYLAACGFKEIAVPLPAVCLVLEGRRLWGAERAMAIQRLLVLGLGGLAFLAVRRWAIGGIGYVYGTNHAWLVRTVVNGLGPFGEVAISTTSGPPAALWTAAVTALGVRVLRRRRAGAASAGRNLVWTILLVGLLLAGWGLFGAWCSAHIYTPEGTDPRGFGGWVSYWAVGLLVSWSEASLHSAFQCLLFLALGWILWRRRPDPLITGFVWMLFFVLPLTLSPGPVHRYYLSEAGLALMYAFGFSEAIVAGITWLAPRLPVRLRDRLLGDLCAT